jgi:pilus assembly protein CpaB
MKHKILIMLGLALIFGAGSIFVADRYLQVAGDQPSVQPPVAAQAQQFASIVVASRPLRYGDPISAEALSEIPWPEGRLPEGAYATVDQATLDGDRIVLQPMEANEPVLLAKLSGPDGRASLANMLGEGKRAVTIRVDEIASVAGFVTPGDRVDIVLTRDESGTTSTEIILQNLKVLSTDQTADMADSGPRVMKTVTLEVDVETARKITLARSIGALSLSLRAAGDDHIVTGSRTTISDLSTVLRQVDTSVVSSVMPVTEAVEAPAKLVRDVVVTRALTSTEYQVPEDRLGR